MTFFDFLVVVWSIRTVKAVLFWLYLWQLKEYHAGRFIDHFRTAKGRQIFLNPLFLGKIVLFGALFLSTQFAPLLFILYAFEALQAARQVGAKKLLKPVFTKKILFLLLVSIVFALGFVQDPPSLLLFDILTPGIVSVIVLLFQPFAALGRQRIVEKARQKRNALKNLMVVGITGSYGKTSTKEFLARILEKKFKVLKTKEHQNSEVGIARCILDELKPEHEVFVCEMGAYGRGGIKLLASIAKPTHGVLTGINEQHMATFGSQENIINTKYELIESLPASGVAFFNANNKYCRELYEKTKGKKMLYGENAEFPGGENILGAAAVARELGMTEEEVAKAVQEVGDTFPGMEVKKGKDGITILNAMYSANPDGVMANLEYLKTFSGKKVLVMPCLIELGFSAKEVHERVAKKITEVCDLAVITTKEYFETLAQGSDKVVFSEDPQDIVEKIKNTTQGSGAVLLEGRVPSSILTLL
ncbi:MAG: hypothetical protein A3B24_02080 [Candidatus Wildermuthbacteria bacterium RIFCSPLOWO2_01_FULL_48_16]|uniref:Mur ligase central domain-containing protein n=1 Tax=Candidatus Wildermuthbacteria bacterium RIFCSPLOWO2_01_FULL_48_16 TaxID=1802461 RepID=A0A1G2RKQ1_9BACT|nr:MAG: hypothetical protein A3B24_02080 [Candidatus Wildermuthbacteria bacterium RIFCSPLOWO2_01_FULL_48_16]